jgi:hypothetical protein
MTLFAPANFQDEDMGSYAVFFEKFIDKLVEAAKDFEKTVEEECRELGTKIGERVLANLHLINADFPFADVLRPLGEFL